MDYGYVLTPGLAWLVAGTLKFLVNSLRARRLAFSMIGYGGWPSTHSTIVTAMAALIGLREGVAHPAFGVAITLAFIVMLDASSLRRQIGKHAQEINRLPGRKQTLLRERMGHTPAEIAAGVVVGVVVAFIVKTILTA